MVRPGATHACDGAGASPARPRGDAPVSSESDIGCRAQADGMPVLLLPMKGWRYFCSVVHLARWLREHPVDVLHAHGSRDQSMAIIASRLSGGAPVVRTKHNVTRVNGRILYRRFVAAFLTVSEFIATGAVGGRHSCRAHPPGLHCRKYEAPLPRPPEPRLMQEPALSRENLSWARWDVSAVAKTSRPCSRPCVSHSSPSRTCAFWWWAGRRTP